ncbi:winged helix-turn-helix domain-containing protein [Burkholderia pyrrocinia]
MAKYLIEGQVVFDNHLMTLSRGKDVTALVANEAELLNLLMQGTATKLAVIDQVWESKGMYVTEGSYHQLVRSLRVKLEEQGIASSMIRTLPRLGLKFLGDIELLGNASAMGTSSVSDASVLDTTEPEVAEEQGGAAESALEGDVDGAGEANTGGEVTTDSAGAEFAPEPEAESTCVPEGVVGPSVLAIPAVAPAGARAGGGAARYVIYALLAIWAGVLVWKTFFPHDSRYQFRFQETDGGIHYFSNGRMEQKSLLSSLGVQAPAGSYVYQIEEGPNDWLAVCPKSIYSAPELCESYFVERTY